MTDKAKLIDVVHEQNGAWAGRCSCGSWACLGTKTERSLARLWERHARDRHGRK
jgi:hypothetical protein